MNDSTPEYTRRYLPVLKQNPYDLRRPSIFAEERTYTTLTGIFPQFLSLKIKALQQLIRPKKRHLFGMNDRVRVNLLTRLRVDFSDLKLHKFDHRFNCDSSLCSCGQSSESTFFLHCQSDLRRVLLDSVSGIISNDVRVYP